MPAHALSHCIRVFADSWAYGTTEPATRAGSYGTR